MLGCPCVSTLLSVNVPDDCPIGTVKDEDGDCRCPPHTFCVGSDNCRESVQRVRDLLFVQYVVGEHFHYFDPRCTDCKCDAQALDDFSRTEMARIDSPTFDDSCERNKVAAKCVRLLVGWGPSHRSACFPFLPVSGGRLLLIRFHAPLVCPRR